LENLKLLSTVPPNDEEFQDTLSELRDTFERHIEEEEGELFPKAEELCGRSRLNEMGQQMIWMKSNSQVRVASMRRR
jgi:hemerythrin-like domain-containing protein